MSTPGDPLVMFVVTASTTTRFLDGQVQYLRDHGIRPLVVSSPGPELDHLATTGIETVAIPMERQPSPRADLKAVAALRQLMRARRPDIVNAPTPKAGLLGMVAARAAGVPRRVFQVRGFRWETMAGVRRRLYRGLDRVAVGLATDVLYNSPSLRTVAEHEGIAPQTKGHVIGSGSSNGVDVERFRPPTPQDGAALTRLRSALGLAPSSRVLGFVGRLTADKGIADVVATFRSCARELGDVELLLVGDHEAGDPVDAATLQAIRDDDRIHTVGARQDIPELLRLMDVLVFPSRREGFPNVVLEAQASGVPVVAYRATGTVDALAPHATGELVRPDDVSALAAVVQRYISDPGIRRAHGHAARRRAVALFEQKDVWGAHVAAYRAWLAGPGTSGPNGADPRQ